VRRRKMERRDATQRVARRGRRERVTRRASSIATRRASR
jgi:hypothetical protein